MTDLLPCPLDAIKNLREHQEQLDHDGIMVGVSRQALDEVLDYIDISAPRPNDEVLLWRLWRSL